MADDEPEFEILSEGGPPDEHDLEILETLEEHGADLSEPREIRVNLSSRASARRRPPAPSSRRPATRSSASRRRARRSRGRSAPRDLRVDRDNVTGFRSHFHDLAERHGGEFELGGRED